MPPAPDVRRASTVLVTKLRPPTARDLVPRPALVERLARGPSRRLTVVRAPAGWGKTTLLGAWASSPAEPRPFAWVSLDTSDGDPVRFWSSVAEALGAVDERLPAMALPLLRAPGVDLEREALPVLLNAVADTEPAVLVLDDLHVVRAPEVHRMLAFFVERAPPTLEVAIATRGEPPLPLPRLRARGELLEIDETHLRFSPGETEALLNRVVRLGLPPQAVRRLHERTEGWAAALYLAALSLRERTDREAFIEAFSGDTRQVVDYLRTEVLAGADPVQRDFLLRTSILDRLTAPVCATVTGRDDAATVLHELERSNLLLVPLDDRRRVYRYHHLFGELLRGELELAEPRLVPELHRRAAEAHLDADDEDRAIHHLLEARETELAVELIVEHWTERLLARGEHRVIDAWLRALPEGVVGRDPRLCVARVFTDHSLGQARAATGWVDVAEAALGPSSPARQRGDVATARASNALQTGDVGRALSAAERALAVGDPASPWMALPHGVRAHAHRWSGDAVRARECFGDWLAASEVRGQLLGVVCSHAAIALLHAEAGRAQEARDGADRALERGGKRFAEHWVTQDAHVALAVIAAAEGDRELALRNARRAIDLARRGGPPGARANALLAASEIMAGHDADELVAEAAAVLAPCPDPGAAVVARLSSAQAGMSQRPEPAEGEDLTDRELVVLRLLASDLSQREIGAELYVSLNTVKTHARHIFRKLGAEGREEAVAHARERGLLGRPVTRASAARAEPSATRTGAHARHGRS